MFYHELALELGFPSISLMLSMMTAGELRDWEAFFFVRSGGYEKVKKRKDTPKLLKATLGHLVKKKDG